MGCLLRGHGCKDLSPQAFTQLCFHFCPGRSLGFALHLFLLGNQVFGAAAFLLELNTVLHILILEQNAEELNQMEEEEQEDRHHDYNQEAGTCLQIVKYLTHTAEAEGVLTDNLRFVDGQRVSNGIVVTFGGKDQISAAVIDLMNAVGIEDSFTIDDGPVSNNIALSQFAGVFDAQVKDQVAGKQGGIHRFGLDREHPDTKHTGNTVTGGRDKRNIGTDGCQGNGNHQQSIYDSIEDASGLAFFLYNDDLFFKFLGLRGCDIHVFFHWWDLPSLVAYYLKNNYFTEIAVYSYSIGTIPDWLSVLPANWIFPISHWSS